jgi:indole-3-glycerol phosphate synthase/phosphoribosylanthranilate isomerase
MDILSQIVQSKQREIASWELPQAGARAHCDGGIAFYEKLAAAKAAGRPFFISEFKRKSPSEGWIVEGASVAEQVRRYVEAGADAVSVLTDGPFFGGCYEDLAMASHELRGSGVLLLQKDFILSPAQIHRAKAHGADIILLIAAILSPEKLDFLRKTAESLGMGVLVEVHDESELDRVESLDFPVLGINNRDLKTFRTSLNRTNVLAKKQRARGRRRWVVAESGVLDYRHLQMLRRNADGFLIGTGLMRSFAAGGGQALDEHFQCGGRLLFKACGIRDGHQLERLANAGPDFLGLNFSPMSKRRYAGPLPPAELTGRSVAVFYQNSPEEILEVLSKCPFPMVQLYAGDVPPAFLLGLKQRVMLAVKIPAGADWDCVMAEQIDPYAAHVDCFVLDGAHPGSGERIRSEIPADFPYPFLLAGGLQEHNLGLAKAHPQCIGVDIASGIETDGRVDEEKIRRIAALATRRSGW